MSAKNALAIQRCEFSRKELDEFLSSYFIPSEYRMILPHLLRPFLMLLLGTLVCTLIAFLLLIIDCHLMISSVRKHIPSLLARVITHIEGWHQRFFFIQDTIVPSKFPQLLLKENMLDVKSFKDKLPSGIEQNPQFQRLAHYPVSARAFDDPDVKSFKDKLPSGIEQNPQFQRLAHYPVKMSIKNFIYTKDDEDLNFLPKDFSLCFNTGSPFVFINTEPVRANEEPAVEPVTEPASKPVNDHVGTTVDLGGVPKEILLFFTLGVLRPALGRGSAKQREASAIKDDTLMLSIFDDDEGLEDCLELKDAIACHLKISAITPPAWKGFLDNHLDVDLLDLYDRCYARQVVVDNAVNRRSRELLEVIKKLRGEADVMRAKELARKEEYEGLRANCEAAMTDFDKNPVVLLLREKMSSLAAEAKEYKGNLDRLMLESPKWSGYLVSLLALESKVTSLEGEKPILRLLRLRFARK
nr:hypothetical protein [Tanacetum cinerariifolium]